MNTVRNPIHAAALSGIILISGAVPALADSSASASPVSVQATASVTKSQKLTKLSTLTQTSATSQNAWFKALGQHRTHNQAIAKYNFNWSTNYCSSSPNTIPGGYDFKLPCYRHDFGYRNYKKLVGNAKFKRSYKLRIDQGLHADLNRECARKFWDDPYTPAMRRTLKNKCYSTATDYYIAVRASG